MCSTVAKIYWGKREPKPAAKSLTHEISKQGAYHAWSSAVACGHSHPHHHSLVSVQRRLTIIRRPRKNPPGKQVSGGLIRPD